MLIMYDHTKGISSLTTFQQLFNIINSIYKISQLGSQASFLSISLTINDTEGPSHKPSSFFSYHLGSKILDGFVSIIIHYTSTQ